MTKTLRNSFMITVSVLALSMASIARAPKMDIVDTAVGARQFKTLASLLTKAGLVDVLKGKGPFTVFAPTDAAFAKVPKAILEQLGNDGAALKAVLTYHVVAGNVLAKDVVKLHSAKTVEGEKVEIKVVKGTVFLNGKVKVIKTDIGASNGTIHVIDSVLLPPSIAKKLAGKKVANIDVEASSNTCSK